MNIIHDMYAMRYRIRAYTDKLSMLHNNTITEIRFTAELKDDDDLKELKGEMTKMLLALDQRCTYAECDVADPLDWEKGDLWHKAQYVWDDKIWREGKDLVRQKGQMSIGTEAMIKLYDDDEHNREIWDLVTKNIYDPRNASETLFDDDVMPMIRMTEPKMVSKLAEIGAYTCDWVAVARHIKDVQKRKR